MATKELKGGSISAAAMHVGKQRTKGVTNHVSKVPGPKKEPARLNGVPAPKLGK